MNISLELSEKLRNVKNQSESKEEKMNLLIKKLKKFLLGNLFLNIGASFWFFLFLNLYTTQISQPIPITLIGNDMSKSEM